MQLILPSLALGNHFVGAERFIQRTSSNISEESIKHSYHAFSIGNIGILLAPDTINEVADKLTFCKLPNTSKMLFGMANLRGNIIPIFDLHKQLNITPAQENNRKILIIGKGIDAAALLIDDLPIVVSIAEQDKCTESPALPDMLSQFVTNSYLTKDKIWLELDLKALFYKLSEYI